MAREDSAEKIARLRSVSLLADLSDRTHVLLLLATVSVYTILVFGLLALGAHVQRNTLRILMALEVVGGPGGSR